MDKFVLDNLIEVKHFLSHKKVKELLDTSIESFDSLITGGNFSKLSSVAKGYNNYKEQKLIAQLMEFFISINQSLNDEEYKQYITNMSKKDLTNELYRVMLCLDCHFELMQAKILSYIFLDLVFDRIDFDLFCELSEVNRRMLSVDYTVLNNLLDDNLDDNSTNLSSYARLEGLGLAIIKQGKVRNTTLVLDELNSVKITKLGELFKRYIKEGFKL